MKKDADKALAVIRRELAGRVLLALEELTDGEPLQVSTPDAEAMVYRARDLVAGVVDLLGRAEDRLRQANDRR